MFIAKAPPVETLKEIFQQQFPHVEEKGCMTRTEKRAFGIRDDVETEAAYLTDVEEGQFKVDNPQAKTLCFWQIDHCTFDSAQAKRCDCGLWDEKQILLLELKANASGSGGRKRLRRKAKAQLEATLETVHTMIPDPYTRTAIICFNFQNDYPATKTNSADSALYFQETYQTDLQEGNAFTFE